MSDNYYLIYYTNLLSLVTIISIYPLKELSIPLTKSKNILLIYYPNRI